LNLGEYGDKNLSMTTKVRLYESTAVSFVLYGSDCWTIKNEYEGKMISAEMNWLRQIARIGLSRIKKAK